MKKAAFLGIAVVLLIAGFALGGEMDDFTAKRERMVEDQIERRGIKDQSVLKAMKEVKRHLFVPSRLQSSAYVDNPLPIGLGQTISQPYIVAYMSEAVRLKADDKVLEIGTGSGYQAAVLGEIVKEVYTIEILKKLQGLLKPSYEYVDFLQTGITLYDMGFEEAGINEVLKSLDIKTDISGKNILFLMLSNRSGY